MRKRERITQLEGELSAVVEDRNRLARQIHGYRDAEKQAASADFRSREAIRLALGQLFAEKLTPLQRIVDAAETLGRCLDGRPLAERRDPAAVEPPPPEPHPRSVVIREDPMASLDEIRARANTGRRSPA